MIVISGALVLVALVLLIIGLVGSALGWVYASIGVSLAAFAFLVVGILQRRKEETPGLDAADDSGPTVDSAVTTVSAPSSAVESAGEGVTTLPAGARVAAADDAAAEGSVLVVAGRPRYHVEGCRYLTGKEADRVSVSAARAEGFTACGVCKPDDSLAAAAATPVEEVVPAGADVATVEDLSVAEVPAPAPAKAARVTKAAAPVSMAKKPATKASDAAAAKAPAKATKAAAAKPAAKAPAKRPGVVVIPDRDKYHTPDCRYVRGADGAEELSKATATRQGYVACGVCKP